MRLRGEGGDPAAVGVSGATLGLNRAVPWGAAPTVEYDSPTLTGSKVSRNELD